MGGALSALGGTIQTNVADIVSLYKAPQKGMTQKLLQEGFKAEDFPGPAPGGIPDGKAYFGFGDRGLQIAQQKYAPFGPYDGTVIRVDIPQADFDQKFGSFIESLDGEPNVQVAIPNTMFNELNQYGMSLVGGGDEAGGGGDG